MSPSLHGHVKKALLLRSPIQPDPDLLDNVALAQQLCFIAVAVIALGTLVGWFVPSLAVLLPGGWVVMKANTAILALATVLSLGLSGLELSRKAHVVSRIVAAFVASMALAVLFEYSFHISIGLDTFFAADPGSTLPGRMSPQTAIAFLLLSIVVIFIRVRERAFAVDVLLFCLGLFLLIMLSGYAFDVLQFFGLSSSTRTSPQTLLALILLTLVTLGYRMQCGIFSVYLGHGIGSRIARVVSPIVILLPFLLESAKAALLRNGKVSVPYATAVVSATVAILALVLILIVTWKIDGLEEEVRELALRDVLTKTYNRRGFYLLAERALQIAHRSAVPFSVLFIDLDNLKQVNDLLGHEAGSEFLGEVGELLLQIFRKTDVVGRIGGDEFVVAGQSSEVEIRLAAQRLERAVQQRNAQPGQKYAFSFSFGYVTSVVGRREILEDLISGADLAMYVAKRRKKLEVDV